MIIFGTRGVKFTKDEGTFPCPQCATQQAYKYKRVRRFFTLYFIPIIPLDNLGEYVECQNCKGTFVPRVLEYQEDQSSDQFLSEYDKALKHTMVLIMLADGEIDENEMQTVQKLVNKFSHQDITMEDLRDYVAQVEQNPQHVSTYLQSVSPRLNEHGKELVIKCAMAVAAADGTVDASEIALIKEMGQVMEMSTAHLKGILSELSSSPSMN